jgi:hypothetical protein
MSKIVVVTVSLAALLAGGAWVDQGALAEPPIDPNEPLLVDIPELDGVMGLRYVQIRRDVGPRRGDPVEPPPGIKPVDPLSAGASSDPAAGTTSRGLPTFLGAQGGGTGYGFGGSGGAAAPRSERSAEPALGALRDLNRALGY